MPKQAWLTPTASPFPNANEAMKVGSKIRNPGSMICKQNVSSRTIWCRNRREWMTKTAFAKPCKKKGGEEMLEWRNPFSLRSLQLKWRGRIKVSFPRLLSHSWLEKNRNRMGKTGSERRIHKANFIMTSSLPRRRQPPASNLFGPRKAGPFRWLIANGSDSHVNGYLPAATYLQEDNFKGISSITQRQAVISGRFKVGSHIPTRQQGQADSWKTKDNRPHLHQGSCHLTDGYLGLNKLD